MSENVRFNAKPNSSGKVVAVFKYQDADGALLYEKQRFEPKSFRFCRDENGKTVHNIKGIIPVPYRLPVWKDSSSVIICEGEKDAETLAVLGFASTTAPFGAASWPKELGLWFKGKRVYVLYDVGEEKNVTKVASALHGTAKDVRICSLGPDRPREFDITDLVNTVPPENSNRKAAQISLVKDVLKNAKPFTPPGEGVIVDDERHLTDLGNAMRFAAQHGKNTRFCHQRKKWLHFNGARWIWDDIGEAKLKAKETVKAIYQEVAKAATKDARAGLARHAVRSESAPKINAMLSLAESEPGMPVLENDLDVHPFLLNLSNGTLDLRTGKLHAHKARDLHTRLAPVVYDPKADCSLWKKFLDEIMYENENLISFLQRAVGYALTGDTQEQCMFILFGSGANGKTTFLQAIAAMLGDYWQQSPTETLLVRRPGGVPNDVARLKGARFVSAIEVEEGRRLAESLVKALTGGDTITARFLFGEFFEFQPQFKLFIGTNHKPVIKGTDLAIWRRIRLVPFTVAIPEDWQDKELLKKLKGELPGILNWALAGCLAWQKNGLGTPEEVRTATDEYRTESDVLTQFLDECITQEKDALIKASMLYAEYKEWCEENGERAITGTAFGKALLERGFDKVRLKNGVHYLGIQLEVTGE